jgi:hypothetical protein
MYRQMLEDIACSPWDRGEADRLLVLHLLDRLPIAERAVIGRRLLTHLGRAPRVETGTTRWDARRYLLGNADLHLGYVVCNQLTDLHREAFRQWVMLRHHEWTTALDPDTRTGGTTVAVMLTPRHDKVRPWDTTVLAVFGELIFEPDELAAMQRLWNRQNSATDPTALRAAPRCELGLAMNQGPVVMAFRDKVVEMGYARSTTETSG